MKKKIRYICIDGIEKSGKTSVNRELRRFLKDKEKEVLDFFGVAAYNLRLDAQNKALKDNENFVVLKEGSILQVFYDRIKKDGLGAANLEIEYTEFLRQEKEINHSYGGVHFFLIPEDEVTLKRMFGDENVPEYVSGLLNFFKGINQYTLTQGLDIRLIPFDEEDRIYDIRDKILNILEKEYSI